MGTPKPYYVHENGKTIFRRSEETKNENGTTNITIGFPICDVSEYVDAEQVALALSVAAGWKDDSDA